MYLLTLSEQKIEFSCWFRQLVKMRALLDQENWAEVDVPEEFQTIVNLLFVPESVSSEESHEVPASTSDEVAASVAGPVNISQPDSNGSVDMSNTEPSRSTENINPDASTSSNGNSANTNRGKSSLRMLYYRGVGYHMVNWYIIMLMFYLIASC